MGADVRESGFELNATDGHLIRGTIWMPSRPAKAQLLIVHGRGEHGYRYRDSARTLARHGYQVQAADARGHGRAAREAGALGDFGPRGFSALVDDLAVLCRHLRAQQPALPLLMFAHSMGSFAAQYFLMAHSRLIDGLVLSGTTAIDLRDPRKVGSTGPAYNDRISDPRTDLDWLSRDEKVVDQYIADQLCGFQLTPESNASIYRDSARTADPVAYQSANKTLPLALMTGDRDPVNNFLAWFHPLAARLRDFGFTDVSTYVYGGARHELLNETNRQEVLTNLTAWLDRVVGEYHH